MINQQSDKAIINWQSFNIGANEHTQFIQPSTSSLTLNRITGGDPAQILGRLSANGGVMIVDPNGVIFGPGSRVDVNRIIASTADIKNNDFMADKFNFSMPGSPNAMIVNQGTISIADRGLAAFVAPAVQNSGVIVARLGKVQLASANTFILDMYGDRLVNVAVDGKVLQKVFGLDGNPVTANVDNSGQIIADGGFVALTADVAREVVNEAINTSGVIQARTASMQNGEILLDGGNSGIVMVTGKIDATGIGTGQTGGNIQILGDMVLAAEHAEIDVSGDVGGGTVLMGGDYHGGGNVRTATRTAVTSDVNIKADAITSGDGGKVIVWASDTTNFYGTVSGKGGSLSGNGGFAEVSGKKNLGYYGKVDLSAPIGKYGSLLLDPTTITIIGGTGDGNVDGTTVFKGAGVNYKILFADALSAVYQSELENANANIFLESDNAIKIQGTFVNNELLLPNNRSISMITKNANSTDEDGIFLDNNDQNNPFTIRTQGTGSIYIETGNGNIPVSGYINVQNLQTDSGNITIKIGDTSTAFLNLAGNLQTNGGNITINAAFARLYGTNKIINVDTSTGSSTAGKVDFSRITYFVSDTSGNGLKIDTTAETGGDVSLNYFTKLQKSFVKSLFVKATGTNVDGTITINGDITTADLANNYVLLWGKLSNTKNVNIDTDHTNNKGMIQITSSAVSGAGHFYLYAKELGITLGNSAITAYTTGKIKIIAGSLDSYTTSLLPVPIDALWDQNLNYLISKLDSSVESQMAALKFIWASNINLEEEKKLLTDISNIHFIYVKLVEPFVSIAKSLSSAHDLADFLKDLKSNTKLKDTDKEMLRKLAIDSFGKNTKDPSEFIEHKTVVAKTLNSMDEYEQFISQLQNETNIDNSDLKGVNYFKLSKNEINKLKALALYSAKKNVAANLILEKQIAKENLILEKQIANEIEKNGSLIELMVLVDEMNKTIGVEQYHNDRDKIITDLNPINEILRDVGLFAKGSSKYITDIAIPILDLEALIDGRITRKEWKKNIAELDLLDQELLKYNLIDPQQTTIDAYEATHAKKMQFQYALQSIESQGAERQKNLKGFAESTKKLGKGLIVLDTFMDKLETTTKSIALVLRVANGSANAGDASDMEVDLLKYAPLALAATTTGPLAAAAPGLSLVLFAVNVGNSASELWTGSSISKELSGNIQAALASSDSVTKQISNAILMSAENGGLTDEQQLSLFNNIRNARNSIVNQMSLIIGTPAEQIIFAALATNGDRLRAVESLKSIDNALSALTPKSILDIDKMGRLFDAARINIKP